MKKLFVFLAEGFEETEAIAVIDVLRRAAFSTVTVSVTGKMAVKGAHGIEILADTLFEDVAGFADGDALVLPGGMPGADNLDKYAPLTALINDYYRSGKYLAAICAAPLVFGNMGLLQDKEATCYPGFEKFLKGALLSGNGVVQSGKIITGKGPGYALPFGLKIVEALAGKALAGEIAGAMLVRE